MANQTQPQQIQWHSLRFPIRARERARGGGVPGDKSVVGIHPPREGLLARILERSFGSTTEIQQPRDRSCWSGAPAPGIHQQGRR